MLISDTEDRKEKTSIEWWFKQTEKRLDSNGQNIQQDQNKTFQRNSQVFINLQSNVLHIHYPTKNTKIHNIKNATKELYPQTKQKVFGACPVIFYPE